MHENQEPQLNNNSTFKSWFVVLPVYQDSLQYSIMSLTHDRSTCLYHAFVESRAELPEYGLR